MSQPDPSELQQAVQLHFSGRLDDAERMYRSMLSRFADNPHCTHLLGMLLHARGQNAAAEPLLLRSLQVGPEIWDFHNNIALFFNATGRQELAMQHLKRAIELNSAAAAPYENMGMVLEMSVRQEEAAAAYAMALNLDPNRVKSLARRGWVLFRLGRSGEAMDHWQRALQIDPQNADAHDGLCVALSQMRRIDEAILHGQQSVQSQPDNPDAWMNLGGALAMQSRFDEAIASVERAVQTYPTYVNAIANLAWLCKQKGDVERSLELCKRAIQLDPNSVQALNQYSHTLHVIGDLDGAIAAASKAVQLQPNFVAAWVNLGSAQLDTGEVKSAIDAARRALQIQPNFAPANTNLLLALNYDPDAERQAVFDEHRRFEVIQVTSQGIGHLELQNDRDPERLLRIGYVSPDFRKHAVAGFIEPILRSHDRSKFEISCYSDARRPDAVTRRLQGYASAWHETADLSDEELARQIADHKIDILIDLAGHTADGRLLAFARKPAPVQMSYLGYLNTTGLDAMDYRITDSIADPPGEAVAFYSEKLLRLPCFFCYQPPSDAPGVGELPMARNGFVTVGSLNQPAKFNSRVLDLWARVLKEIPDARLLLNVNSPGAAERRVMDYLTAQGITKDRLEMVYRSEWVEYLATYNRIDIALDPFPFSGHTTSCDALWMGVPVITLPGQAYASRTCTSVLTHLGLEQLVAKDEDGYIRIAKQMAADQTALAELRGSLRQRITGSTITNAAEFTANLESAYRLAWRTWCGK